MSGRAETMKLVKDLQRQGFIVIRTGSGHWRVTHPERDGYCTLSFSPKGAGLHKALKQLEAMGYRR